nr:phage tail protein [uncultured Kingella sp.]
MSSIIPSNNSPLLHALARLTEAETAAADWRLILRNRQADTVQEQFVPHLAWENSISDAEGWAFAENGQARRNLIKDYITRHQTKGTPSMIRQLFRDLQLGEIDILENVHNLQWDGSATFDGNHFFGGGADDWAKYAIVLRRVISVKQAGIIKQLLAEIAPLRCELVYLDYRSNPLYWDGEIRFDGSYTFGAITHD